MVKNFSSVLSRLLPGLRSVVLPVVPPFVTGLLSVFSLLTLIACDSDSPATVAAADTPNANHLIEVRITQGTNLAVAVNPVTGDRVLALQGALYAQMKGELRAKPITQWFDDAWEPSISPDGLRLVYKGYRDGTFDLWELALIDGAEPVKLTDSQFDDREPQYSPDSTRIIFSSDRLGSYDIWELDLSSDQLSPLTENEDEAHSPTWAPDSKAFAYVISDRSGSKIMLQYQDAVAKNIFSGATRISGLQWLADGQKLSFRALDRDASGNAFTTLRTIDLVSNSIADLTSPAMDVFPFRASWSSDQQVTFTADGKVQTISGDNGIQVQEFEIQVTLDRTPYDKKQTDFDSREPRPALGISYPVVSPDGEKIAFSALGDLWRWSPKQSVLTQITDDAAADQTPGWSADGKQLVYISDRDGQPRIQILELESNELTTLMINQKEISFPSWSPDGRQLAYFTDVPANPLLHVVGQLTVRDLDTEKTKTLLAPMPPQTINWTGDGEHLLTTRLHPYSDRYREGLYLPVVVNIETGESHSIKPIADRSVTHASLASNNHLVYIQDGVLNALHLDDKHQSIGAPTVLFDDLADTPSIGFSGETVVFQSGARLLQLDIASGQTNDITPPISWQPDQPLEEWILRAGRMFDGISDDYQTDVDIHVHGNRIVLITSINLDTTLKVIDASDKVVIPGLFESHAHIGDHNLSETQGRAWLAYGITSVRDPGSNPYLANERKEAWGSGRRIGPRTFITGHNIDGNRVFYAVVEGITSDEHLERSLQRSKALEVDFIKTYVRLSDKQQRRIVEFAHNIGIPVTSHELLPAAAYGVDHIEHFTGTSRRGYATKISELGRAYQDVVEVLSKSGMGIVPTMVVPGVVLTFAEQDDLYGTAQFNAFYGTSAKENYQNFMAFFGPGSEGYVDAYGQLLSKLIDRGALVGTGTDSPFTPFAAGLHAELRLYQREGLKPHKILNAATLQSATIAGVDNDLGSIHAGKLADMVIIDGDPLSQVSDLSNITHTIKNGRIYSLDELLNP
ncbi:MAG: Tol biopolymer transport system component/imidazolonepropionase-like amidohydrolase [Candidatus Azotimanducaceae bacterium]|jgi:Tol biopolymer transport system component/imidazolonepropionase-like amidohydrolase